MKNVALLAIVTAGLALAPLHAVETGKPAPDFQLTDVEGKTHKLSDYKGKFVVLEWVNHGCPFVKKHYGAGNMQALQKETTADGSVWLSIASSAKGKQGHFTAEGWKKEAKDKNMASSAILLDANGKVGKSYGAKTTPHIFIVDPNGTLIYQGAIDDKPTTDAADIPGATNYVRSALQQAKAGGTPNPHTTQPYGCSVKY